MIENAADRLEKGESIVVEGVTADYVWYHSKLLINKMQGWATDFERVVSVMESRHKEHQKIIGDLLDENRRLKTQLEEKK